MVVTFLIYTVLIICCVYAFSAKKNLYDSFFSRSQTGILKGVGILTVLWAHSGMNYGIGGIQWIAGIGVALFLIFSGYGLTESYKKNGLNKFWTKRIIGVLIPFYFVYIVATFIMGNLSLKRLINIVLMQNVNWYIQYIVISYIIFWVSSVIAEHYSLNLMQKFYIVLALFIVWFFIDTLFFAMKADPFLRARQMLSFPLGILISNQKNKAMKIFKNRNCSKYFIMLGALGFFTFALTQLHFLKTAPYIVLNTVSLFTVLPLTLFVLWLSVRYTVLFNSKFLTLIGDISYELYLIQAFSRNIVEPGSLVSLIYFFIFTIAIGFIAKKVINNFFKKPLLRVFL